MVLPVHLAETRQEALDQAWLGAGRYQREYFEAAMGRPLSRSPRPWSSVVPGLREFLMAGRTRAIERAR